MADPGIEKVEPLERELKGRRSFVGGDADDPVLDLL
jgi:hypothetical protein